MLLSMLGLGRWLGRLNEEVCLRLGIDCGRELVSENFYAVKNRKVES
jgi:hypothetical protein